MAVYSIFLVPTAAADRMDIAGSCFVMTADDLARRVAEGLKTELGPDVTSSTEAAIRGDQSRGWGEAAQIGAFLISACRFGWEVYKDYKSAPELKSKLLAATEKPAGLSQKKADAIIDEVVDQLMDAKA